MLFIRSCCSLYFIYSVIHQTQGWHYPHTNVAFPKNTRVAFSKNSKVAFSTHQCGIPPKHRGGILHIPMWHSPKRQGWHSPHTNMAFIKNTRVAFSKNSKVTFSTHQCGSLKYQCDISKTPGWHLYHVSMSSFFCTSNTTSGHPFLNHL